MMTRAPKWIESGRQLYTTNLVVAEMQTLLSRFRDAAEGVRFIDSLYQDPSHRVIFVADAVSFEVMREHGIRDALALDAHFALAGFELVPS